MKPSRFAFVAAFGFLAFLIPANSCGPFFPDAVFVQNTLPDGPYADYAAGRIGIPQPGYRVLDMVVAYDWLNGHGLTPYEQQQAVALNRIQLARDDGDATSTEWARQKPGLAAWIDARNDFGVPAPAKLSPADRLSPGGTLDSQDRSVPGQSYQSFANCLDPAFATAADTFKARKAAYPAETAALADWMRGQDAVFANCAGEQNRMPADAPASAPQWLQQDRAYQQAAAKFYQTDYDGAIARLRAIAADASSPWRRIARLVAARALIRKATIGQITEVPSTAIEQPGAPYSEARAKAQQTYTELVKQQQPARLAEAAQALNTILAEPSMQPLHADAAGLLDFVDLRLDPAAQAQVLASRLTAPDRPQTPGRFEQAAIDLRYYLYPPYALEATAAATQATTPASPLFVWMDAMRAPAPVQKTGWDSGQPDPAKARQRRRQTTAQALAQWQSSHADTWLIAALANAAPADPAAPALTEAAARVPNNAPAWTAATYNRLRLTPDAATVRHDLAAIQPALTRAPQRSTINLFQLLNQRAAPTLSAFLHDAASLPAGITDFDSTFPDPPETKPDVRNLCGVNGSQATTLLFNPDAAAILNTRMPLALLAQAAEDSAQPHNLSFQIAQAAWTRAVLTDRTEIAKRMTPILTGCYPSWKPWLAGYDSAVNAADRRAAGLLALMHFPSNTPLIDAGLARSEGFAGYSMYRLNWWGASTAAKPPTKDDPNSTPAMFLGAVLDDPATISDPPFLTAADRTDAAREMADLRAIPCSSDYFAAAALDWAKQHPPTPSPDPRTIDILGYAERAVRNGCRTDATAALNHRLFVVVQTQYPNSEWAKKYKTWE